MKKGILLLSKPCTITERLELNVRKSGQIQPKTNIGKENVYEILW
jgi:hypothetical protein